MKYISAATVFASTMSAASAFVPNAATTKACISSVKMSMEPETPETPNMPEPEAAPDMSIALPFVPRPKLLDGSLPGDFGFDPFNFGGPDKASLWSMREAEIKHSRLAMLAVVGWPMAELFDKKIAAALGLVDKLTASGASPSTLNGGLDKIQPLYWALVIGVAAIFELDSRSTQQAKGKDYVPGDCGFDPLNLFPTEKEAQFEMQLKEIKHGRLAMMAMLGFVVQEALYRTPVVAETPFFFKPFF